MKISQATLDAVAYKIWLYDGNIDEDESEQLAEIAITAFCKSDEFDALVCQVRRVLSHRVGNLHNQGWLPDNDLVRHELDLLSKALAPFTDQPRTEEEKL